MEGWNPEPGGRLALLADTNRDTARAVRPWLMQQGLDLVHARAGLAALELLQRLPERFMLAVISLELPDLPGAVLLETLKLFRPKLPLVFLTDDIRTRVLDDARCLTKPVQPHAFNSHVLEALGGRAAPTGVTPLTAECVARARACFAVSGNLVEAARELSRGDPSEGLNNA